MRFMVSIEAEWNAAEKLDTTPGGPGKLFGAVAERFRPEAFYVEAARRAVIWVIDFADAAAVTELMHLCVVHAGAYPTLRPVLTGAEAPAAIGQAIARARGEAR